MRLKPPPSLLAVLVIGAAVWAAYANSLHGPFVFDDASSITTNPTIHQLWPLTGPLSPPTTNVTAQGRPILNLSLALNYACGGTAVEGYHVVNGLIHVLAGLVLFGLVRRTPGWSGQGGVVPVEAAIAIAVLWAVHPLHTESVTYVIQRAESLMGLFYLLTLYCFARAATEPEGRGRLWLGLTVVACALGMGTKEVMVTAPLMVFFYDRTFFAGSFGGALRRRTGFYASLAGTWLILAWLVGQGGGNRGGSVGFGSGVEPWAYWLTQFEAVATYLKLSVWPTPLVFEYGAFWVERAGQVAGPVVVVLALLGVTIRELWRRSAWGFAGAWFFGILAPTSLAPGTTQMIVEHRMYLPLAAVMVVAVATTWRVFSLRYRWWVIAGLSAGAITLTAQRNRDYRTDVALWSDTVAKRPGNPLAHFMLAGAQERAGKTAEALASYAEALRLKPNFSVGLENYGELLLKVGRRAEAIGAFEAALRLQPEFADARANLGNALLSEGRVAEAVESLRAAVRLAPEFAEMHFNLANALAASGRSAEAAAEFQEALSRPAGTPAVHLAAHYELANLLAMAGRQAEAVPHYEAALRARPDYAEAHHNLGSALFELGRLSEAAEHYEATLRLAPDFPQAGDNLRRVRERLRK